MLTLSLWSWLPQQFTCMLDGYADAWKETAERKPDKVVGGRLEAAKKLYEQVRAFKTPEALPQVN